MTNNYWVNFWKEYTEDIGDLDEQSQVLRTLNKKPITEELWNYTIKIIEKNFEVSEGDNVLDLCCGNGMLSKFFADKGARVTAVDISNNLMLGISDYINIKTINSDIRNLKFENNSFSHVMLYAGIQYLDDKEAILLVQNIYKWLKPEGILFIGDIPDFKKRWTFFNSSQRQKVFFDNIINNKSIVGNWFEKEWFDGLGRYCGFANGNHIKQNEKLIYSEFRFDYLFKK